MGSEVLYFQTNIDNLPDWKLMQEFFQYFHLQEVKMPSSHKNITLLSEEQMKLVRNEEYFLSEENVWRIRYTLKMDTLSADKVIELFEKLSDTDKTVIEIYKFIIGNFKIQNFVWKNGKWTLPEGNYSCTINGDEKLDFSRFISEYPLSDLYFDSYKQVYEIPYDVLKNQRADFNNVLIGDDKVILGKELRTMINGNYKGKKRKNAKKKKIYNDSLYYNKHFIDPKQSIYLNVIPKSDNNVNDDLFWKEPLLLGTIDFLTLGGTPK